MAGGAGGRGGRQAGRRLTEQKAALPPPVCVSVCLSVAGFVHQHELFFSHLTVREHLMFHAINRNGASKTLDECSAMVERELVEVDLVRSADTIIGGTGMYVTKGR